MRLVHGWVALVIAILLPASAALAERRVALVIGNSAYEAVGRLPNTTNDARAMAAMLKGAGFDSVILKTDLGVDAFRQSLRDFTEEAANADMAVFYYAGHGLEIGGVNLLVPVDARLRSDIDAEDETVAVDRVLRALDQAHRLRLVILDACRENPFAATMKHVSTSRGGLTRGFQRMDTPPPDTLIAFATEAGTVAADGDGRNSPFTKALVDDLAIPGLDLRIALGKVKDDVLQATDGRQRPYVSSSLGGSNFPLIPGEPAPPKPAASQAEPPAPDNSGGDFKFAEGVGSAAGWEMFLRLHPTGPLADVARDRLADLRKRAEDTPPAPTVPPPPPPQQDARLEPPQSAPSGRTRDLVTSYVVGGLNPNGDNFLALRTGPSGSATLLRQLPPGAGLNVLSRRGAWAYVTTADGAGGWVFGQYVLPRGDGNAGYQPQPVQRYAFVTGLDVYGDNFLALKAAPSIRATRILKMGPGTKLRITGRSGDWVRVDVVGGPSGWAAARYVGCCTTGP